MRHVTAHSINAFAGPKHHNIKHLVPCVRYGPEMFGPVPRINAIVQLDGVIPIVTAWKRRVAIIAGCPCRKFDIGIIRARFPKIYTLWSKLLSCNIIEVVVRAEKHFLVVVIAEAFDVVRCRIAMVLTSDVVWHEVNDNL